MRPSVADILARYTWTDSVKYHGTLAKFAHGKQSRAHEALKHIERLGLADSPPKRILDLGCALGMFATACRLCGHEVVAANAFDVLVAEANAHLDPPIVIWSIAYGVAFPQWGTFDLITMHGVNLRHDGDWWGVPEFLWLFRELRAMLNPAGMIDVFANRGPATDWICDASLWPEFGATAEANVLQLRKRA